LHIRHVEHAFRLVEPTHPGCGFVRHLRGADGRDGSCVPVKRHARWSDCERRHRGRAVRDGAAGRSRERGNDGCSQVLSSRHTAALGNPRGLRIELPAPLGAVGEIMKEPRISATDAALTRIEQVRVNRKQPQAGFPEIHDVRDTTDHA
jgi:hypothetical protein